MTITTPTYLPTNELVAVAWLGQRVPGITSDMVATKLPQNTEAWEELGFITCRALSGNTAMIDVPIRRPIFTLDFWATRTMSGKSSSAKPPWNLANQLVELVRDATESPAAQYGAPVTLPAAYQGARVQAAYFTVEPYRVEDDPAGYARFTASLAVDWVRS